MNDLEKREKRRIIFFSLEHSLLTPLLPLSPSSSKRLSLFHYYFHIRHGMFCFAIGFAGSSAKKKPTDICLCVYKLCKYINLVILIFLRHNGSISSNRPNQFICSLHHIKLFDLFLLHGISLSKLPSLMCVQRWHSKWFPKIHNWYERF